MNYKEYFNEIEDFNDHTKQPADFQNYIRVDDSTTMKQQTRYGEYAGKKLFEASKTFQEISKEVAIDSPFGKNSVFYKELREIITGQIPKL